jgi:hypothetical protein
MSAAAIFVTVAMSGIIGFCIMGFWMLIED